MDSELLDIANQMEKQYVEIVHETLRIQQALNALGDKLRELIMGKRNLCRLKR